MLYKLYFLVTFLTHQVHKMEEERIFAVLRESLVKIQSNRIDSFELNCLANQYSIDLVSSGDSLSCQKYVVQKALLDQILKYDSSDYYKRLLSETEKHLVKKKTDCYTCCLAGCVFRTRKHRLYIRHLKRVHTTHDRFSCQYMLKCLRQFSDLSSLEEHVKVTHFHLNICDVRKNPVNYEAVKIQCLCTMLSCRGIVFEDLLKLITHVINHHSSEYRECIFEGCSQKFFPSKTSAARSHFLLKHKKTGNLRLKRSIIFIHLFQIVQI